MSRSRICQAWENWRHESGEGAERDRNSTIITEESNVLAASIRNQTLPPKASSPRLGEPADIDELRDLLTLFPAERMRAYPISTRVNTPNNKGGGV